MLNVAEHNCGDCKLRCIDCEAQICPKCMVQCPVGNRCKGCTKKFTSHVLQIDFWVILRSFAVALIMGSVFSVAQAFLLSAGFYMLIFVYFLGTFAGNLIFKISGRKIGPKIATTVALGLFVGSLCTSFCQQSISAAILDKMLAQNQSAQSIAGQNDARITSRNTSDEDINSSLSDISESANQTDIPNSSRRADISSALALAQARRSISSSPISLALIIFILGNISPFLGWGNPFANLFRR